MSDEASLFAGRCPLSSVDRGDGSMVRGLLFYAGLATTDWCGHLGPVGYVTRGLHERYRLHCVA